MVAGIEFPRAAFAAEAPKENIILTITGKIGVPGSASSVTFDRAALEALGMDSFETTTPWHNGKMKFEGVPMTRLLDAVHAHGTVLVASALDDYSSEIPVEDFGKFHVLLALKRNGQYMPVTEQGPLFIIYPFDSNPELQNAKYHSRSVWQVVRMEVK